MKRGKIVFEQIPYSIDYAELADHAKISPQLTESNQGLLQFMSDWLHGNNLFEFQTSGSTSAPKKILLSREQLLYSARQTLESLSLDKFGLRFLLAISPDVIGGKMLALRALLTDADLHVIKPSTHFSLQADKYDLVSLVPMQIDQLIKDQLIDRFEHVLIGGAPLSSKYESQLLEHLSRSQKWFATYGMTETASHVALRQLGSPFFRGIGDVVFKTDDRICLALSGSITQQQTLQTNDVVELLSNQTFKWLGRSDFTINSGGYKVQPEKIESILQMIYADADVLVTSVPDQKLGQKVVCLSTKRMDMKTIEQTVLHRYERPKEIIHVTSLPVLKNGKIDRKQASLIAASHSSN
ncbi:MAG: O-succinylbenzoic acid--CoA ligase [Cyclobacteriaceae bacterium]